MKKFISLFVFFSLLISAPLAQARYQRGYFKPSTGKYVSGHFKTNSDNYKFNNYSTKGNTNPYTGKKGYASPYKTYKPKSYRSRRSY